MHHRRRNTNGSRGSSARRTIGGSSRRKETDMADLNGRFVWYELMTTDLAAARGFYSRVVGWNAIDSKMSGMDYWMFTAGEKPVTGLMTLPEDARKMGAPPNWVGYVGVGAKVTANGGTVHVPPTDIPNV